MMPSRDDSNGSATTGSGCRIVRRMLLENRWGGQALISLFLSVLSGMFLTWQYNDAQPFYSTAAIEVVIPFGAFWRSLHFYSSQLFFLLLSGHFVIILWKNNHEIRPSSWIRLTLCLPVSLLLLFTGYILRGDITGESAGAIAEHITLSIPVIGDSLNSLLFSISANGIRRVYANHLIGLFLLGGICVWPHLRRYTAKWSDHLLLTLATLVLSASIPAPMEPDRIGHLNIQGPWFFLGLQELLRHVPIFWAGVAFPSLLILLLLFLSRQGSGRITLLYASAFWLILYATLTGIGMTRG